MRILFLALLLLVGVSSVGYAQSTEVSRSVVSINGAKYYVHPVIKGDTLYSLSKLYGVSQSDILAANPALEGVLKLGVNIKIPHVAKAVESKSKPLSPRKARKIFEMHKVVKGETLYSIARRYEISVATLREDNPELDPVVLSIGDELKIRRSEQGSASEDDTRIEIDSYTEQLNSVAPAGTMYHVVKSGESVESIAEANGMSAEDLRSLNYLAADSEVEVGVMILVRTGGREYVEQVIEQIAQVADLKVLRKSDVLDIAVLLPLTSGGGVAKPFVEFYQGFLMGVEDLRREGHSVNVNLYNTERDAAKVDEILSESRVESCDLIVGPVYEDQLQPVVKMAERFGIPVVSPLATIESIDSPVLFQMAPSHESRYEKLDDELASSVTLIYGTTLDSDYEAEIKAMLDEKGVTYSRHNYSFTHHTAGTSTKSDLRSVVLGADGEEKTIFVMSNNEVEVDRILSSLASAYAACVAENIGTVRDIRNRLKYQVVANPDWRRYNNIDRAVYFRNRVVTLNSYLANRNCEAVRAFDSRYGEEFGAMPSLYAYRGYDVAKVFGHGMYSDMQYGMEGRTFTPLQTTYRFERVADERKRSNINWMKVEYETNFKQKIE